MKSISQIAICAGFWLLACGGTNGADSEDVPRVGALGNLATIRFEGQKQFSDKQLRRALRYQLEFILASEAEATLPAFLRTTEELLHSAYQRSGFGESTVNARLNAASNGVVVRINEGPRLYCGNIRLSGLETLATNDLIEAIENQLNKPPATNSAAVSSGKPVFAQSKAATGGSSPVAAQSATNQLPPKSSRFLLWHPGGPAALDPDAWATIEESVTNAFQHLGYPFAEFTVNFLPRSKEALSPELVRRTNDISAEEWEGLRARAEGRVVDMVVQVSKEGPLATVANIEIQGIKTNKQDEVLRFLAAQTGERFTESWRQKLLDKLNDSGRFVRISGSHKGGETDGRVTTVFDLEELPEAPPLSQALPTEAAALQRMRRWLLDWQRRDEDLVLRFGMDSGSNTLEVILSPGGKTFTRLAWQRPGKTEERFSFALMAARGFVGIQCSGLAKRFVTTNFQGSLTFSLEQTVAAEAEPGKSRSGSTIGLGFTSEGEGKPPLVSDLKLMPAFFTYLALKPGLTWKPEDKILTGTSSNLVIRLESATGRLLLAQGSSREPGTPGLLREAKWSLHFERDYLGRAEGDWLRSATALSNACNEAYPFSSALAFLAEAFCQTPTFASIFPTNLPPERMVAARAVLGKVIAPELFEPCLRVFAAMNAPDENPLPATGDRRTRALMTRQPLVGLVAIILAHLPEIVPVNSWPEAAVRMPLMVLVGRTQGVAQLTRGLYERGKLGPLACLVLGRMLEGQAGRNVIIHGLVHSEAESFTGDLSALLDEQVATGQMVANLGRARARLDEKEVEAQTTVQNEPEARFLRRCAVLFRQRGNEPLTVLLQPALEEWWNAGLRDRVKAELRKRMGG